MNDGELTISLPLHRSPRYLQPQLNKAAKNTELQLKGDVNPKDFILFRADHFQTSGALKDNTGDGYVACSEFGEGVEVDVLVSFICSPCMQAWALHRSHGVPNSGISI